MKNPEVFLPFVLIFFISLSLFVAHHTAAQDKKIRKLHHLQKPDGWDKQKVEPISENTAKIPDYYCEGVLLNDHKGCLYLMYSTAEGVLLHRVIQEKGANVKVHVEDYSITIKTSYDATN